MTMDRIYDRHEAAFKGVSAYVILRDNALVGRVAFKRGASGKVWCYLHIFNVKMVRGGAGGGGYDKASAAFYEAAGRLMNECRIATMVDQQTITNINKVFAAAKLGKGSAHWEAGMCQEGFTVHSAV